MKNNRLWTSESDFCVPVAKIKDFSLESSSLCMTENMNTSEVSKDKSKQNDQHQKAEVFMHLLSKS
jgi:hypothetical protein